MRKGKNYTEISPGPWKWTDKEFHLDYSGAFAKAKSLISGNETSVLEAMCKIFIPNVADMRAIEAVPELLKALKDLLHDYVKNAPSFTHTHPEDLDVVKQARAVIAKVEGK